MKYVNSFILHEFLLCVKVVTIPLKTLCRDRDGVILKFEYRFWRLGKNNLFA